MCIRDRLGTYRSVDVMKVGELTDEQQQQVKEVQDGSKKTALFTVAVFPLLMLVSYLAMMGYFKSKGGYKPVVIEGMESAAH